MEGFDGRVAVITGGASGIGRALAARARDLGMQVVIADVEPGALDATAAELGVVGIRTDVSDAASVQALADAVVDRFGRVDLLCNNAGVGGGGFIADATLKDWQWVINVNLWGVVHGIHSFLPHLLANPDGGHIVNTASMAGLTSPPGIGPYNASKHAVVAISETLAAELRISDAAVGVSVLCPGYVRTNIIRSQRNRPDDLRNEAVKPAARAGNERIAAEMAAQAIEPEQVAEQVLDAVRDGRFWILTHPELVPEVLVRARGIADAAGLP